MAVTSINSGVRNLAVAGAQRGFTYIVLLLALAFAAAALCEVEVVWRTVTQRAREAQLLFIGGEYKRAIASYYHATPGTVKQLPRKLEDLLLDTRYPVVRRHLRRIYADPMTGRPEWGQVATPDGITGVYSLSEREPFRKIRMATSAAPPASAASEAPQEISPSRYSDWKFVADFSQSPALPGMAPGTPSPLQPPATQVVPQPRRSVPFTTPTFK